MTLFAGLIAIDFVLAALIGPGDWGPVGSYVLLALLVIAPHRALRRAEAFSVETGSTLVFAVCWVAVGVLPGLLLAATAAVFIRRQLSWRSRIINVAIISSRFFAGAALVHLITVNGWVASDEPELMLVVFGAIVVGEAIGLLLFLGSEWLDDGRPDVTFQFMVAYLPLEVAAGGVAAVCAYLYGTIGAPAILVTGVLLAMLSRLSAIAYRGEMRGYALDDALREQAALADELLAADANTRRHLAAQLHDDALQRIADLRMKMADPTLDAPAARSVAVKRLEEAETSLRNILTAFDASGTRARVGARLAELADDVVRQGDLGVVLDVDPTVADLVDPELVACVRELTVNAVRHARASQVWVTVGREAGMIEAVVADDGIGGCIDRKAAVESGHVGLALVGHRAAARGGALRLEPRPGRGLVATVTLRSESDDTVGA